MLSRLKSAKLFLPKAIVFLFLGFGLVSFNNKLIATSLTDVTLTFYIIKLIICTASVLSLLVAISYIYRLCERETLLSTNLNRMIPVTIKIAGLILASSVIIDNIFDYKGYGLMYHLMDVGVIILTIYFLYDLSKYKSARRKVIVFYSLLCISIVLIFYGNERFNNIDNSLIADMTLENLTETIDYELEDEWGYYECDKWGGNFLFPAQYRVSQRTDNADLRCFYYKGPSDKAAGYMYDYLVENRRQNRVETLDIENGEGAYGDNELTLRVGSEVIQMDLYLKNSREAGDFFVDLSDEAFRNAVIEVIVGNE